MAPFIMNLSHHNKLKTFYNTKLKTIKLIIIVHSENVQTYKHQNPNIQLNNLINKNKVRRNLTNKIKRDKWTNKENEMNKTTKKKITLSKIKWENR
jgi:hypothetical protein